MDAFYASIEQRDFPAYQGKPLAVGGSMERGVVATASYEARKFGVRSAIPSAHAYRLCPQIIFVKPRFEVYKSVSQQIRGIFLQYTDRIEPLSLDEAYLDVTQDKQAIKSATLIARKIKEQIRQETGLTASAGISFNKFLAKIASDYNKPDGLKLILPEDAPAFLEQLPIKKFHGIGKVTAHKMHQFGIHQGEDLKKLPLTFLQHHFGKSGHFYYQIVRGIDERPVNPNRIRKSIGAERTFISDIDDLLLLQEKLEEILEDLLQRLQNHQTVGSTLTLKVKYADFTLMTRSITTPTPIKDEDTMKTLALSLLEMVATEKIPIRLLGLTLSKLKPQKIQNIGSQLSFDFRSYTWMP